MASCTLLVLEAQASLDSAGDIAFSRRARLECTVAISMGCAHSAALTEENGRRRLYVWGSGSYGKLGLHGDTETRYEPTLVALLRGEQVVAVSAGLQHTAAVTERGQLFTWGTGGSF